MKQIHAIYPDDIIVFQSGYTMTGIHEHEAMRKIIINYFPAIRIVLLPQTIFYKEKKYAEWAIGVYKDRKNVLLLTRDRVSYEIAKSLFGSTQIVLYPDIVTTLIGKMTFTNIRNGILFCVRDDWERLYTKKDMNDLIQKLSTFSYTERTDMTIKIQNTLDRKSIEKLVIATIEKYSRYRVVITDRFHGTIFALAANTPVIVLKTTDHKVTIGAEWFQPYMTGYIYVADNLSDAEKLTKQIFEKTYDYKISYSFKEKYYDHLKLLIDGENNHDNL
ncbi:MAG: polysaccharide pyruvyl transferase family protein [Spirochaetes bacterium]|nr:polysaccharide pyruvyl transferase family protein [Spirochaetota bacterium]